MVFYPHILSIFMYFHHFLCSEIDWLGPVVTVLGPGSWEPHPMDHRHQRSSGAVAQWLKVSPRLSKMEPLDDFTLG